MNFNATEFAVTLGESINWTSTIIGIAGGIFGIYIWFYDRKNMRKATLYFPLFIACRGITEIIREPDALGENRCKNLFASSSKTLDEIIYSHGSIIHLKRAEDLNAFLSLKKIIDVNMEFIEKRSLEAMKDKFKGNEFKEVEHYANALLERCKEEVKYLKKLPK